MNVALGFEVSFKYQTQRETQGMQTHVDQNYSYRSSESHTTLASMENMKWRSFKDAGHHKTSCIKQVQIQKKKYQYVEDDHSSHLFFWWATIRKIFKKKLLLKSYFFSHVFGINLRSLHESSCLYWSEIGRGCFCEHFISPMWPPYYTISWSCICTAKLLKYRETEFSGLQQPAQNGQCAENVKENGHLDFRMPMMIY